MCDIKKNKQLDRFMTSKQNLLAGRLISIIVFQYTRCWKLRKNVGEVNVWSQKQIGTTVGSFLSCFLNENISSSWLQAYNSTDYARYVIRLLCLLNKNKGCVYFRSY